LEDRLYLFFVGISSSYRRYVREDGGVFPLMASSRSPLFALVEDGSSSGAFFFCIEASPAWSLSPLYPCRWSFLSWTLSFPVPASPPQFPPLFASPLEEDSPSPLESTILGMVGHFSRGGQNLFLLPSQAVDSLLFAHLIEISRFASNLLFDLD